VKKFLQIASELGKIEVNRQILLLRAATQENFYASNSTEGVPKIPRSGAAQKQKAPRAFNYSP